MTTNRGPQLCFMLGAVLLMTTSHVQASGHLGVLARCRAADANAPVAVRLFGGPDKETAVIVCDMWDKHWCKSATARVVELAPRIDAFCQAARQRGAIIVHAPSACMKHYENHPARLRIQRIKHDAKPPKGINEWRRRLPGEPDLPIEVGSEGGCPDDPPCKHGRPWTRQIEKIAIDADRDFISDSGEEIWRVFELRGIRRVMLVGVHANMCVLGRPFGLRQWVRLGRDVALVRDLTDTMYDPRRPPHVSHFHGTDLLVAHVERYVCPTISSHDVLGPRGPFHFKADKRPDLLIVSAEDEYETARTLPQWAEKHLAADYRIHYAIGDPNARTIIPGIDQLYFSDVGVFSIRRWPMRPGQMGYVRNFIEAGKALVAIRTSSHAFAARAGAAPRGVEQWPDFDQEVLGVHYTGHYSNHKPGSPPTLVWVEAKGKDHPVVAGVPAGRIKVTSWLYKSSPISKGTDVLMSGVVEGFDEVQPVTVARKTDAGGCVAYTSLGHPDDFRQEWFARMLAQAVRWAAAGAAKRPPRPHKITWE